MYDIYKMARDKSWMCLIESGAHRLPVSPVAVAKCYGIVCHVSPPELLQGCSGLLRVINGAPHIFVDNTHPAQRQRFTIAHELGHYLIGHLDDASGVRDDKKEYAAERFAADLLMPACVLWGLNIHTPEEIAQLCNVSMQAARIRAERMEVLYRRNMFLSHPLERQVYQQFRSFIDKR